MKCWKIAHWKHFYACIQCDIFTWLCACDFPEWYFYFPSSYPKMLQFWSDKTLWLNLTKILLPKSLDKREQFLWNVSVLYDTWKIFNTYFFNSSFLSCCSEVPILRTYEIQTIQSQAEAVSRSPDTRSKLSTLRFSLVTYLRTNVVSVSFFSCSRNVCEIFRAIWLVKLNVNVFYIPLK